MNTGEVNEAIAAVDPVLGQDTSKWANGTILKDGVYYALFPVTARFGYYIDEEAPAITVNGKAGTVGTYWRHGETFVLAKVEPAEAATVTFAPGGGTGTMDAVKTAKGYEYKLPECGYEPSHNYSFRGWQIGDKVYKPGEKVMVEGDITATAVWYWFDVINIAGQRVSPYNADDVMDDGGSVKYDPETNTLTLTDATIEMKRREDSSDDKVEWGIRYNMNDPYIKTMPLTIELVGKNVITDKEEDEDGTTAKCGIGIFDCVPNITFTGTGSLCVEDFTADNENITYTGIDTRKETTIDGAYVSVDIPGTAKTFGYDMHYTNKLSIINGGLLDLATGSNNETYSFYYTKSDVGPQNWALLNVDKDSQLIAVSENSVMKPGTSLGADTVPLGALVDTDVDPEGARAWDRETPLTTYKYMRVPYIVKKDALEGAIIAAQDAEKDVPVSKDGKDVLIGKKWTTEEDKQALDTAIDSAKLVFNDPTATKEEVKEAMTNLETAVGIYNAAKKDGLKQADPDKIIPSEQALEEAKVDKKLAINVKSITTSAKAKKKTMTATWKKVSKATNYKVAYRKAGAKKWTEVWTKGKNSYTFMKMKTNGLYEFKLMAVRKSGDVWTKSKWSKVSYRFYAVTKQKVKAGKKSATVKVKKVKKASGYEVLYGYKKTLSKMKTKSFKGAKKTKLKIKKLKKGKKVFVRTRPYKKYKGKKYIGILTGVKRVKVRK